MSDRKYLEEREQLIAQDRALRVDATAAAQGTDAEQRADQIVRELRTKENESVWGPNAPAISGATHIFPGMHFLTARDSIFKTNLFNVIRKMPKAGLLHVHLEAAVATCSILRMALKHPAIHVRTRTKLSFETMTTTWPEFRPLPESEWSTLTSLIDGYVPGLWVPLISARESFDLTLGGPEGFDDWAVAAMSINPSEAYTTYDTTYKIWQRFGTAFDVSGASPGLTRYLPLWTEYIREFFLSSMQDGISYIETRIAFAYKHKVMLSAEGTGSVPHREWLVVYDRVLNEVKAELAASGQANQFLGSKTIYCARRNVSCEELDWHLEDCISLKQEFPHLICGFDLVGHEDPLNPLIYYIRPLRRFVERQKELGINIPFIFHAGETLGDGTNADVNLYDAVLLGTKRIGHGFSLVKHPKIMELCRTRDIAVEVCPISNEVLRLTGSMPMHPLPVLMNQGVHVALGSDGPARFGNMGLSYDFFQVLVASEVSGLFTLRELARDSIKFSCLEPPEKEEALALYNAQWTTFVKWVIGRYGSPASSCT